MKIVLIGSGNVASFYGSRLQAAGHTITHVYSRNVLHAKRLALKLKCTSSAGIPQKGAAGDLFIIAVTDDALLKLSQQIRLPGKTVVHTSGSVPLSILDSCAEKTGVVYPLLSITPKVKNATSVFPVLIESNGKAALTTILTAAKALSNKVQQVSSHERMCYHIAAVFANNFTTHLYAIAESLLAQEGLQMSNLIPLIQSQVHTLPRKNIAATQTGPAVRNDRKVITRHLKYLKSQPEFKNLYSTLTRSIRKNSL